MQHTKISDGDGWVTWVVNFGLLLSFQGFVCWVHLQKPWIWLWCTPASWVCAWLPQPSSIADSMASVPVPVKWRAFLPLKSISIVFLFCLIYFCTFFVSLISLLNKIPKWLTRLLFSLKMLLHWMNRSSFSPNCH